MKLDAWTTIGDQYEGTGRWVLYQDKARLLSEIEKLLEWPPDESATALRAYEARAGKMTRGGLWLVEPNGKVAACSWVPVRNFGV